MASGGICTVSKAEGSGPVSGAVDRRLRLRLDGSFLRRCGLCGRRVRLRNRLGAFALVVKVTDPARVRLFAVGTEFSAHGIPWRIVMCATNGLMLLSFQPWGRDMGHRWV